MHGACAGRCTASQHFQDFKLICGPTNAFTSRGPRNHEQGLLSELLTCEGSRVAKAGSLVTRLIWWLPINFKLAYGTVSVSLSSCIYQLTICTSLSEFISSSPSFSECLKSSPQPSGTSSTKKSSSRFQVCIPSSHVGERTYKAKNRFL